MMNIPEERFHIGDHFQDYLRIIAETGAYGPGPVEEHVRRRLEFARRLEPQSFQRKQPNGATLEIRRNPLPQEIGREHVGTPVTNAQLVCRLLLDTKKKQ